ncbi:S1C family serine protease [Roseomonas harenae]|uniref:S1C family serine protease n=1 Tax=Muricoccus harenae TaxID=2692566 RepID=UPI001331957B|nr:trypsin-like peptidase domain-containing protein [Roseomonas harenae]
MPDRFRRVPPFLWIATAALLLILAWHGLPLIQSLLLGTQAEPRVITPRGNLAEDERSTIALFEAARSSVVFISTTERVLAPWSRNALNVPRGTGSGFVWDAAGHVVTNHHVLAGASGATVRLADGRAFSAALVGTSPAHDLAVLRIGVAIGRPSPLPIGTSADLRVGQKVFAIGNPFGLDWTLTTGIISALNRELPAQAGSVMVGLVQTDAAINPGNSGGPLLDSAGRLIGVNTAIFSPSGASAGIGFAVPVDVVNRVVPRLIADGGYVRSDLGIRTDAQLNEALSARLGVQGVFVLDVVPGSTAAIAGLRPAQLTADGGFIPGDIIIAVAGRPVSRVPELLAALDQYDPGATVGLTILRGGRSITLDIPLQAGGR